METEPASKRHAREARKRNNSRLIIAVLATVFGILLIYKLGLLRAIGFAPAEFSESGARTAATSQLDEKIETPVFTLAYPNSWRELTPAELKTYNNEFITGIKRLNPTIVMWVKTASVNGGSSSIEGLPGTLDRMMSQKFKNFKKVSSDFENINGERALRYAYKFDTGGKLRIGQIQYIIIKNEKAYYLIFQTRNDDEDAAKGEIGDIARSFKIK